MSKYFNRKSDMFNYLIRTINDRGTDIISVGKYRIKSASLTESHIEKSNEFCVRDKLHKFLKITSDYNQITSLKSQRLK